MKAKITVWVLMALVCGAIGCKKASELDPGDSDSELRAAATSPTLNQVSTIAGAYYTSGSTLVDGVGADARFLYTAGIQLTDDGNMYIADGNDGVIRKLSLITNAVSTITLPAAPSGEQMLSAAYVGVAKNGTINVITYSNQNSDFPEAWIFKPGQPAFVYTSYYASYRNLVKDPYAEDFWCTRGYSAVKFKTNSNNEYVGTDAIGFDADSIYIEHGAHASFSAMCIGYNKVKYFSDGQYLYKFTPGGVSQRIFKEQLGVEGFTNVRNMVINKDGRTMYIVDAGYIRRIDQGKITTIAGPNGFNDNRDGKGRQADVHASCLALSKDEGTLYFSDYQAKTIRKIILR
ncbi:hypothetical protein IM792_01655 [Mucilaginibacter sp. JRF]|uniref:hypothetical protein n=1 Tax=Mucilaginibacter sp. JRF TaxID=2780088 RepID=UPI001880EDEB|nr:hypothetical protein [Mucilaginibacter sp. JRF]MBE9583145.1 hypothetical protein [Mucilaginibacter sp. JRF]